MWLALLACVLGGAAIGLSIYGSHRWQQAALSLNRLLDAGRVDRTALSPAAAVRYDPHELEGLPAPVQRYFRAVLKNGQPVIAAATIDLVGTFNMSATGEQWKPFTSTQRVVTRRPGFVWDAQVAMFPGVPLRVVDSYAAGVGHLRAAVLGLFTMADVSGGGEIARGELMRWLAEAAWYPTALLPSQGVRWQAVDDTSANATIADGTLTVSLMFDFDDAGLIASVRAAARGAGVGKDMVMLPWVCSLSNYQLRHGMLLPMAGEAAWLRPQGRSAYFKGSVANLSVEFLS